MTRATITTSTATATSVATAATAFASSAAFDEKVLALLLASGVPPASAPSSMSSAEEVARLLKAEEIDVEVLLLLSVKDLEECGVRGAERVHSLLRHSKSSTATTNQQAQNRNEEKQTAATAQLPSHSLCAAYASLPTNWDSDDELDVEPPDELCCPPTLELYQEPVRAGDGKVYERSAIEAWIHTKSNNFLLGGDAGIPSPIVNVTLPHLQLEAMIDIKEQAHAWRVAHRC